MLVYSTSVSVDGFITGREGDFGLTSASYTRFTFSVPQTVFVDLSASAQRAITMRGRGALHLVKCRVA